MSTGPGLRVLCFRLGGRMFAVDIMGIREILRGQRFTPVPHTPAHVAGVLNLRGSLIPVLDLYPVVLGEPAPERTDEPKLVVVRGQGKTAALLVDQVLDVVTVDAAVLTPVPGARAAPDSVVLAAFQRDDCEGEVVVRPMMYLALTYDHRIVDGREAVVFLRHVKELIETPARILIET